MGKETQHQGSADGRQPALARRITLPLLILYGLGVTIGAGIYVLIGVSVAGAGIYAPASFLAAAVIMAFTAGSFAELSGRHPQSAGEAIYIDAAFGWLWLTRMSGAAIVLAAMVAAAAIAVGCVGYIEQLVALPRSLLIVLLIGAMGIVAAYGILESVSFAAFFTVIEILGLLLIIATGLWTHPELVRRLTEVL
jgi:amino acid transporter